MVVHLVRTLILGVGLAGVFAPSAEALGWSDVPDAIQQRIDSFDQLPELHQPIRNVALTKKLRDEVGSLYSKMIIFDGAKRTVSESIQRYLELRKRGDFAEAAKQWQEVHDGFSKASETLKEIIGLLDNSSDIALVGGIPIASHLKPTLVAQRQVYSDLADLPPPVSDKDQQDAARTADLLNQLVKRVEKLQQNLQSAVMSPVVDDHAMTVQMWIAVIFGAFFIVLLFATAILLIFGPPKPIPDVAMLILRVVLALAAAGFGTVLSGMLSVKINLNASTAIQATSGCAIFLIIYLLNPPQFIKPRAPTRPHRQLPPMP